MYENESGEYREIGISPPLCESIERAAYEKFMEDEERLRRGLWAYIDLRRRRGLTRAPD